MNISYFEVNNKPVVVVDDFYSKEQSKDISTELDFLTCTPKFKPPTITGSAINESGDLLKKNGALWLDDIYENNREISNILTESRSIFEPNFVETLISHHWYFEHIKKSDLDTALLSYYENGDYYRSHTDAAVVTVISWFYREPKKFFGGDLILDGVRTIECINNRVVLFPSIINHEVTETTLNETETGWGRFALSQFIGYRQNNSI